MFSGHGALARTLELELREGISLDQSDARLDRSGIDDQTLLH
jgi:hypothetical protein